MGFFDPDAPVTVSNTYATFGHMLVGNVRATPAKAKAGFVPSSLGEVLLAYRNPHPAEPRDHRYTAVVWRQKDDDAVLDFSSFEKVLDGGQDGRCFFDPVVFAASYGLGDPIGVATALVRNTSFVSSSGAALVVEGR